MMGIQKTHSEHPERMRTQFAKKLHELRISQGLSLAALAERVHYSRGHLNNVEHGTKAASQELAEACDQALGADGELRALVPKQRSASPKSYTRPAQLPAAAGRFVGRREHLAAIDTLAAHHEQLPVAVLHGPPGVGKTTLALHWAHRQIDRFEDGQLFADLRGYSRYRDPVEAAETLEEFLISLGLSPSDLPATAEERAALFRTMTHGRRLLIVLDNAVSSEQVRALLPGDATSMVLVTTRRVLTGLSVRPGATQLRLDPFTPADSFRLLRDVVGARVDQEPDAAHSVLDRCGHLPLAVAVAAERIAAHPLRLSDLADDLAEERNRLGALAVEDEDTSVRTVISWSYRALAADTARVFRLLGLHPGKDINVEAAAALANLPLARAGELLRVLAAGHLVAEIDRDHFRLHDLLRIYATERAFDEEPPAERDAAQLRELTWYLRMSRSAAHALAPYREPDVGDVELDYAAAFRWCETELQNFPSVIASALRGEHPEIGWQISQALFPFLHLRKPWTVWDRMYRLGLEGSHKALDPSAQAEMLLGLGLVRLGLGMHDEGLDFFLQALEALENHDDPGGTAWCHVGVGLAYAGTGRHAEARESFELGLAIQQAQGDQHGESVTLMHLAEVCSEEGHHEDAIQYAFRALSLCRTVGDQYGEGLALHQIGKANFAGENLDAAVRYLEDALATQRAARDSKGEADTLLLLNEVLTAAGDHDTARDYLLQAATILGQRGEPAEAEVRARLDDLDAGRQ